MSIQTLINELESITWKRQGSDAIWADHAIEIIREYTEGKVLVSSDFLIDVGMHLLEHNIETSKEMMAMLKAGGNDE